MYGLQGSGKYVLRRVLMQDAAPVEMTARPRNAGGMDGVTSYQGGVSVMVIGSETIALITCS